MVTINSTMEENKSRQGKLSSKTVFWKLLFFHIIGSWAKSLRRKPQQSLSCLQVEQIYHGRRFRDESCAQSVSCVADKLKNWRDSKCEVKETAKFGKTRTATVEGYRKLKANILPLVK